MSPDNIPLKDVQALLGEKDMVIYVLSKNCEELALRVYELTVELQKEKQKNGA